MNVIFLGSSAFSVPALDALLNARIHVPLVITRPDRPAGRGMKLQETPVKECAIRHGLKVVTELPTVAELKTYAPDFLVVVSYGKFLPHAMVTEFMCVNIHPSLLPKYRGPSPIQSALFNGDTETGVTTMLINDVMDAGDILLQERTAIDVNETYDQLETRLALAGGALLIKTLRSDIQALRKKQDDAQASICRKITSADEVIDWSRPPLEIHDHVRAIPAYTLVNGKRIKILETRMNDGQLEIIKVQPEGKKPMLYEEFKRGYKIDLLKGT